MMTNTSGFIPETGEWNDSLTGNFMWSNTNIGETLSDVQTPFTWSMISTSFEQMNVLPEYPIVGNIAGRAYNNVSVLVTGLQALGRKVEDLNKEMGGVRDDYRENLSLIIPSLPKPAFLPFLRRGLQIRKNQSAYVKLIPKFLDQNLNWCNSMTKRISLVKTKSELAALEIDSIAPYAGEIFWMVVGSAWEYGERSGKVRDRLKMLVGVEDADRLLSNISTDAELLASLGPIVGLNQLARGEITREAYLERWGHRGPHESEVSIPRPFENPDWLDQQLAALEQSPVSVDTMLAQRRVEFEDAWNNFIKLYPRKAKVMGRQIDQVAQAARVREAVRSELVRVVWVMRVWALKAAQMTDLGDDIFLFTIEEVVDVLNGKQDLIKTIPARRDTYERYKSLPPYPMTIRGHFDPFKWAADPKRRSDFAETDGIMAGIIAKSNRENPSREKHIYGAPGSSGVVEGTVRRLDCPEEGHLLQAGEILVTTQTNIGWSPLFPLARAIVTDVGAALSHAAIVARELGIPAVVNCGDATMRLKTGDHVRVDGSAGVVTIL